MLHSLLRKIQRNKRLMTVPKVSIFLLFSRFLPHTEKRPIFKLHHSHHRVHMSFIRTKYEKERKSSKRDKVSFTFMYFLLTKRLTKTFSSS